MKENLPEVGNIKNNATQSLKKSGIMENLLFLQQLLGNGTITEEEYEGLRKSLLNKYTKNLT